jgi:hypothetical protein
VQLPTVQAHLYARKKHALASLPPSLPRPPARAFTHAHMHTHAVPPLLQVSSPINWLSALHKLRWLDLREIAGGKHKWDSWSERKCITIQHVSAAAKTFSRRRKGIKCKVLHDTS